VSEKRPTGGSAGQLRRDGTVEVVAPAKVNLTLLVGPRRPDGFHEIASLMVPVTLADVVRARTAGSGVTVESPVAPGEENLAARAVRELERAAGRSLPVHLSLEKHVPHGAGLAGGSSDAAATLRAVERLYELDLAPATLHEAALAVGSDVPFFLWPGPQLVMGRGNVLHPARLPGSLHLVVAVPDLVLATPDVYGWRDDDTDVGLREFAGRVDRLRLGLESARCPDDVVKLVENDLEAHVVARHPVVGAVRDDLLSEGALAAAMSGSGSAVFGLFADDDRAATAAAALRASPTCPGLQVIVAGDLQPLDEPGA